MSSLSWKEGYSLSPKEITALSLIEMYLLASLEYKYQVKQV